jgi:hypothetical protein
MFTFLMLSGSLIAADYFSTLPSEIKELIISDVVQESDVNAAIKNIKQLRLVNNDFRYHIDNKFFTRYLIDILAQKEFPLLPETKTRDDKKMVAALLLGTPAALNYIKQENLTIFLENIRNRFSFQKVFDENIDFYKHFAKALLHAGVSINNPLLEIYAYKAVMGKRFDFLEFLISKGYDFSQQYRTYFLLMPTDRGCEKYKPLVEFMLKNGVQFNPKILDRYKTLISEAEEEYSEVKKEEVPYCKQIYDLLVNATENQNPNLP